MYLYLSTYLFNWIALLYTWNIVNQLYFNKKINKSKLKEFCLNI